MTRHGSNCTAGTVYTYHERKKDTTQSGFGSQKIRLGKDSVKEFDCCCLTLQPCRTPVITRDGYLYDKEAVLEYIVQQKREIARKLKEYAKQMEKTTKEEATVAKAVTAEIRRKFEATENNVIGKHIYKLHSATKSNDALAKPSTSTAGTSKQISNMVDGKDKQLPSFWVPALTPAAKPTVMEKPDEKVRCPMSGKPLKLKDLIPVNFKLLNDPDDKRSLIVKDARYVCAVSGDVLGNSVPCAVLATSGAVVTLEVVEKLIKKENLDPINGKPLRDKDIIPMQRGSTGFAGTGLQLEAKKDGPALQAA